MSQDRQPGFRDTLAAHGLTLVKDEPRTLQVNTGYLCNLACRHCHLEAGPARTEVMGPETMGEVAALARRTAFETVDVTGGAPEMVPGIEGFLETLAPLFPQRVFRTNLVALAERPWLVDVLAAGRWTLAASLPAVKDAQVSAMRGQGVFAKSVEMLRALNQAGFGVGEGLELHLAANPAGAFMPPGQCSAEKLFKRELAGRHGLKFDSLLVFANVPLGRFKAWLQRSGNLDSYARSLRERFNPGVVEGLMCRTIVSVAWDGTLYDCDFNQAAGLPCPGTRHVRDLAGSVKGQEIPTGDHCFACTAGSGFT